MICKCKICNETWNYSSSISPMLNNDKWLQIINYYNLKDIKGVFICYKCMEKALGRKLKESDLVDKKYSFNDEFRYWYKFKR